MRTLAYRLVSCLVFIGVPACSSDSSSHECSSSTICNLQAGGVCEPASSGHSWCQYPDPTCSGGVRWSNEAGDGLSAECVAPVQLSVVRQGTGTGSAVSSDQRINCGSVCTSPFAPGGTVTLTATPDSGSEFAGWQGDASSCGQNSMCQLSILKDSSVVAVFNRTPTFKLMVEVTGAGSGSVSSRPTGINCVTGGPASGCAATFPPSNTVVLTATNHSASVFAGWSGVNGCGYLSECLVSLGSSEDQTVSAKFEPAGTALWVQQFGSANSDAAQFVGVDPNGDVFVSGSFQQSNIQVGLTTPVTLESNGITNLFVVKLRGVDGSVAWAKAFGNDNLNLLKGMYVDQNNGTVYLTGSFAGTLTFPGGTAVSAAPGCALFVAALNGSDGSTSFARELEGCSGDMKIAAHGDRLIVAGSAKSFDFGNGPVSAATKFLFTAQYITSPWGLDFAPRIIQMTDGDLLNIGGMAVDGSDNVVVGGDFQGTLSVSEGTQLVSHGTDLNGILLKVSGTDGSVLWTKTYTGSANDSQVQVFDVSIGPSNDVLFTGSLLYATPTQDYDFHGVVLSGSGARTDAFVARASTLGAAVWVKHLQGSGVEAGSSVKATADHVYAVGAFNESITSDTMTLTHVGSSDVFVSGFAYGDGSTTWFERFGGSFYTGPMDLAFEPIQNRALVVGGFRTLTQFGDKDLTAVGDQDGFCVAIAPKM